MSKENFQKALEFVFHAEGGYNNDAADPGGPTNMGVTQDTYNAYRKRKKLPYNDVRNIKKQEATNIYYEDYWLPSGADKIDDPKLAIAMFDTAVLHSPYNAKQFYSRSDGSVEDFLNLRQKSYDNIVAKHPERKKFHEGWNNRVNDLRDRLNVSKISPMKQIKREFETVDDPYSLRNIVRPEFMQESLKKYHLYPETSRVYTFEEIGKMKPDEFRRQQERILKDFTTGKIIRETDAKAKVKAGELIFVSSYTRSDGTKVSGYFRRK